MTGISSILLTLALVMLLFAILACCFYLWEIVPIKRRVVARLKDATEPGDVDVRRVRVSLLLRHGVSWPIEWTTPEQANERGGKLLNELWPQELPLPASPGISRWTQRTRKI